MSKKRNLSPKKRQRQSSYFSNTLFLGICIFMFLSIFLLVSVFRAMTKPKIPIVSLGYDGIEKSNVLEGIIVRDEVVTRSVDVSGSTVYHSNNNEKVKKKDAILSIKESQDISILEKQIDSLNSDIIKQQEKRKDLSIFKNEINAIDKNLQQQLESSIHKINSGDFQTVYSLKESINNSLTERSIMILTEGQGGLKGLTDEKSVYEEKLNNYLKSYSTGVGGILSYYIDGFETSLTPLSVNSLTKEELRIEKKVIPSARTAELKPNSNLFKVIKSNVWHIVGYYKNSDVAGLEIGQTVTITAQNESETKKLQAKISQIRFGVDETYLVLDLKNFMSDFSSMRNISFNINSERASGIVIPNSAISEKYVVLIAKDCVVENAVILKTEAGDKLTKLDLQTYPEDKNYYYILQSDSAVLQLNDTLIMPGTDLRAEHVLTKLETIEGVYVVNSGIAKFKSIGTVISNNSESTVVEVGTGGIVIFDNIVLDAKTIFENQAVY